MRRTVTMRRIVWLLVCLPLLPAQAPAAPQAAKPQEDVETLIRQLDSDRWAQRGRATDELLRRGPAVAGPLKAALKAGKLGLEGKYRAKWVLFRIDTPEYGVVWRDTPHAEAYEGIKAGDVIVECNEEPVRTKGELVRALKEHGRCRLKVWRRDEGHFEAVVERNIPRMAGLRTWPDAQELYTRFGHKGPWDKYVAKALRLTHEGKPKARKFYEAAWEAGCRDSLVAARWLWELRSAGSNEEAQELWDRKLKGQLKSTQPGGFWRYGEIPHQLWHLQLVRGRRKEAIRLVAEAIEQATKADAWQGLVCLHTVQFELKLEGPPAEALKFWQQHLRTALQGIPEPRYDLAVLLAERLASEGDPQPALKFVQELPDCLTKTLLAKHYRRQVELAKAARKFKSDHPYMVPVKWVESAGPLESALGRSDWYPLGVLPCPAKIDCEMRISSYPAGRSAWERMATVHLHDPTDPLRGAAARIEWSGRIRYNDDFSGDAMQSRGPAVVNPNQWQAFSLEIRPILTRASINGQARRTTYHSQPDSGDLKAKVSCSGSTAEFRNITLYVGSKVETDNAAVEALLKAFSQSIDSLDLKAAEESSKKLIQILDQVPEANLHVAEIATATARLRTMRSAEGLSLCTKEVLDTATYSHGRWNIENNWLIIRQCRNCQRASRLRLPLRATDFELSAVVEFRNPGKDTYVDLHWNAPEDPGLAGRAPRVWIWPVQGAVGVTTKSPDGDESRGSRAKAELTGPMAFCLRVRGQAARLFIHDGEKPVASVSDFKAAGRSMFIQGHFLGEDGEIHFKDLILRHLPKGRKLDAPAELPEVAGKQPRTQPAK